jgi:hypothetical protein
LPSVHGTPKSQNPMVMQLTQEAMLDHLACFSMTWFNCSMTWLIKIPSSGNGHSSRIKC